MDDTARYQITRLDEHTYVIENGFVRAFALAGTKRALLIDTGNTLPDAREIAERLNGIVPELINTHADPDHTSGNGAFDTFYMHPAEEQNYREHGGSGSIQPVHDGMEISLGERTLRIIEQLGHTPGSIAILDVERRTLFSGDAVQNAEIFMFGKRRDLPRYIDSLKRLNRMQPCFDVIYPSHGDLPMKPEYIETLIGDAESILRGKAEGKMITMFDQEVVRYAFAESTFLCDP